MKRIPVIVQPHQGKPALWHVLPSAFDAYASGDHESDEGLHDVLTFAFPPDVRNSPQWYSPEIVALANQESITP